MATANPPIRTGTKSDALIHGTSKAGSPCGNGPSTDNPAVSARSKQPTMIVATTTAMRMPGIRLFPLQQQDRRERAAADRERNPVDLAADNPSPIAQMSCNGPRLSILKPSSFGIWLISTVSAIPFM